MVYLEEKIINIDNKFINKKNFYQYINNLSITSCKKN